MTRKAHPRGALTVRNHQRACRLDLPGLRQIVQIHLDEQLGLQSYDLGIHLLSSRRMADMNQTHLQHQGPTDVITFDYRDPDRDALHGELLVCPAVAVTQAREHGTSWESEIRRYIIHGVLHLQGYDDVSAAARRVMKREENRRLKALTRLESKFLRKRP